MCDYMSYILNKELWVRTRKMTNLPRTSPRSDIPKESGWIQTEHIRRLLVMGWDRESWRREWTLELLARERSVQGESGP